MHKPNNHKVTPQYHQRPWVARHGALWIMRPTSSFSPSRHLIYTLTERTERCQTSQPSEQESREINEMASTSRLRRRERHESSREEGGPLSTRLPTNPRQTMARQARFRGWEKRGKLTATIRSGRVIYIQYNWLDSLDFAAAKWWLSIYKEKTVLNCTSNKLNLIVVYYCVHN